MLYLKWKASYEKLSDELVETGKRDETTKLIKQFNDGSSNLKQLILNLRDIFYN